MSVEKDGARSIGRLIYLIGRKLGKPLGIPGKTFLLSELNHLES
jgi:hypothetical protein